MEKTVVPERKGARAGVRVTKARSKEAGNTDEAMRKDAKNNQKTRGCQEKIRCCSVDACCGVDLLFQ